MKKLWKILLITAIAYIFALGGVWQIASNQAKFKTKTILLQAEKAFVHTYKDMIEAVLVHIASILIKNEDLVGDFSSERAKKLVEKLDIDEINIINGNGICVCSDDKTRIGYDFRDNAETVKFLALTNSNATQAIVDYKFRQSANDNNSYLKYLGIALPNNSGFLQLGFSLERFNDSLQHLSTQRELFLRWKIGRSGHYDFEFDKSKRQTDFYYANEKGGTIMAHPFTFAGNHYRAIMPLNEYADVRNLTFFLLAPLLACIFLIPVYFFHSMMRKTELEEQQRRELDKRQAADLHLASAIQNSVLPHTEQYRGFAEFDIAAIYRSAREIGGDMYDFHYIDRDRFMLMIADVSGKGIPAAMMMMQVKNLFVNAFKANDDSLVNIVANVNRAICADNVTEMFTTAWIGVVNTRTGMLTYVNAGHNRPFVRNADGNIECLNARGGVFLGVFPEFQYQIAQHQLKKDDLLLLYTDGITEGMNVRQELFGENRLSAALSAAPSNPAACLSFINQALIAFANGMEQSDDLAAIAFVWKGIS